MFGCVESVNEMIGEEKKIIVVLFGKFYVFLVLSEEFIRDIYVLVCEVVENGFLIDVMSWNFLYKLYVGFGKIVN